MSTSSSKVNDFVAAVAKAKESIELQRLETVLNGVVSQNVPAVSEEFAGIFKEYIDEMCQQKLKGLAGCVCHSNAKLIFACGLCEGPATYFCDGCTKLQKMPCSSEHAYLCNDCIFKYGIFDPYCKHLACAKCNVEHPNNRDTIRRFADLTNDAKVTTRNGRRITAMEAWMNTAPEAAIPDDIVHSPTLSAQVQLK